MKNSRQATTVMNERANDDCLQRDSVRDITVFLRANARHPHNAGELANTRCLRRYR